ncbi:DUF202 domain-containing protein [Gordonia rhizosphera]|uniref:DUF202 domain-containing protein n=1 Tax=Gordonia rhizosphera NBRC 16068 TaxID=1108045 RepID=K6WHV1_9ACTN|nr:DUF202 domain-containing protein [Gordonia rhizosphera]GAB91737.1 hypothetical protein GORHZ_143_00040 [Gordonia rhizosphera NBRC 16068]
MDNGSELIDVGAQAERTAMAWQRTGIGVMAVGALVVRWSVTEHFSVWPGIVLAVLGGFATLVLVPRRYRRVLMTVRAGHTPLSRYLVPGAALFMVLVVVAVGAGVGIELMNL